VEALALSAGGMFAAYQAGVYKALWPYWKPDLVVGASAGALNAWLVAARIEPDELIDLWLSPDAGGTLKFREQFRPWKGLCDPDPLLERARSIQHNFERKLPLGVVSVQVPPFRPLMFRNEEITPEHLVASCSIPLFYPGMRVDGRWLVDGGLFEATPVWAAASMGATRVIGVNSLPRFTPWPIHMVLSGMHSLRKMPVPQSLDVAMITPSGKMGNAREAVVWNLDNIRRWVDMGVRDGEQFLKTSGGP
jgi:NTE family protein